MIANRRMTVGQLIQLLGRYNSRAEVEIRLVLGEETYISEPASVVPSRNSRGQMIVQVTNES